MGSKTDQEIAATRQELAGISNNIVELEDRRAASLRSGDFPDVERLRGEIDRAQKRAADLAERLILLEADAAEEAKVRAEKERRKHIASIETTYLKPRLVAAEEFSKHFAAAVECYRTLAKLSSEALTASGLSLPPAETAAMLNVLAIKLVTSHEMFRMGAVVVVTGRPFDGQSIPSLPSPQAPDLRFVNQPERIAPLVDTIAVANRYTLEAMRGDRNIRSGQVVPFAQTARTANQEKLAQLIKQQNALANAPTCDEAEYQAIVAEIARTHDLVEAEKGAA
jgi:hypothetical protein